MSNTIKCDQDNSTSVTVGNIEATESRFAHRNEDTMAQLKTLVGPEDHAQGRIDAPITLVEYGDYECPHCGRAYPIVKSLQRQFGNHLRFVFRNFPLRESHPHAEDAAETAEFAGAHGRFWEIHDAIFENQQRLSRRVLIELAGRLELDRYALEQSLARGEFRGRVQRDFSGGVRSGVNGTPTFFINSQRHDADFEFQTLSAAIRRALPLEYPKKNA
jgi:protein-disulfide isomerase